MCTASETSSLPPPNSLCRPSGGDRWRVAFASSDGQNVDQHFGSSQGFFLYEITREAVRCAGHLLFSPVRSASHDGRLNPVVEALKGCRMVYCANVGPSAVHRLLLEGIQPVRVDQGAAIAPLLEQVRHFLSEPKDCRGHRSRQPHPEGCERFLALLDDESWEPG